MIFDMMFRCLCVLAESSIFSSPTSDFAGRLLELQQHFCNEVKRSTPSAHADDANSSKDCERSSERCCWRFKCAQRKTSPRPDGLTGAEKFEERRKRYTPLCFLLPSTPPYSSSLFLPPTAPKKTKTYPSFLSSSSSSFLPPFRLTDRSFLEDADGIPKSSDFPERKRTGWEKILLCSSSDQPSFLHRQGKFNRQEQMVRSSQEHSKTTCLVQSCEGRGQWDSFILYRYFDISL